MALRQALAHYETFARLRPAGLSDLSHIRKFRERLPDDVGMDENWWRGKISAPHTYVLIATECQLVVGIGILEHVPSAAAADVSYLCVTPDARRRAVGQLLLATLIGRARSEGAALVRAVDRGLADMSLSLLRAGFTQLGGGTWCFGLWDDHVARSYGTVAVPEHDPVAMDEAAAQGLLLMMGAIDSAMLLTRRARQIIQHELPQEAKGCDASSLAQSAARRGFLAWLDKGAADTLMRQNAPDIAERIIGEVERLTPERILGHLSRGHLCMLRLTVPRLSGSAPTWYIIDGFDGYLFRVHDVTTIDDPQDPQVVTASELRLLVGGVGPEDHLIIGKPL